MIGISACNQQSETFLCVNSLKGIVKHYNLESDCLDVECTLAKDFLKEMKLSSTEVIRALLSISLAVQFYCKFFSCR
jgi:hypothetical protein